MNAAPLDHEMIQAQLAAEAVVGRRAQVYRQTASTNELALRMAAQGEPEGTVIFAEEQTGGRGTRGRAWHSAPGLGLWFTVILRPRAELRDWKRLTLVTGVGIARAADAYLTTELTQLKWPNDVQVCGRKLCGILCETSLAPAGSGRGHALVVGVGFNVNHTGRDWPPELRESSTSLCVETGRWLERNDVAAALLASLDRAYREAEADLPAVLKQFERKDRLRGKALRVKQGEDLIEGRGAGVNELGELLVEQPGGLIRTVTDATVESYEG
jgi:BirA family biotin operon repressor/biotin-[acetyl-CoA-carboxylase] ligase